MPACAAALAPCALAAGARDVLRVSGRELRGAARLAVWVSPYRERTHLAWLLDGCAVGAADATILFCGDPRASIATRT